MLAEDQTLELTRADLPIPIWSRTNLTVGDWGVDIQSTVEVALPENVQHNGSYYAHIVLDRLVEASSEATWDPALDRVYLQQPLNKYLTANTQAKTRNLLTGNAESAKIEPDEKPTEANAPASVTQSHWYGNLTLNMLTEAKPIPYQQLPAVIQRHITLEPTGRLDPVTRQRLYQPLVYPNHFWILESSMVAINTTTPTLPLHIHFYPISMFKLQFYTSMEDQMSRQASMMGTPGSHFDEFKRMLVETNPWLLGFTALATLLHSLFDFLAFKNDISFWKNKKGAAGISVRTILANIASQAIVFLYLLDNSKSTSWMILMSQGVGLAIEVWKVKKAIDARWVSSSPSSTEAPRRVWLTVGGHQLTVKGTGDQTDVESQTDEYDQMAYHYLSFLAYPLLFGYALYSLYYEEYKSWYSFILNTLVGYVYAFGFITMTPQLFINYKLKSVAHMPWRTLMYKSLNTFVDDLFAFIITMPTLHRLACLRDDVVFVVYIYQKWIYPMDPNRPNEFGQVANPAAAEVEAATNPGKEGGQGKEKRKKKKAAKAAPEDKKTQ
ncbi:cleft lip and palate transmembrane protein 1-domain-containing protein [Dimargaris cristalligena]|uniref:Cleft lip and palate transmembrane protein 1-domain-containing protein n=1 Tax=Dimargaris cristalligena TaxID=215637 RepID=A0A4Q0A4U7_9FUNG|nr:cleft lip and palate transmembrane protein 1-domain-containing protein [Dimargaris cristalligena]|eukprot:RKP40432.1 cleft lip and palate transmembrane protein 1-domain-containing protein [Dimargaris cristalligena]